MHKEIKILVQTGLNFDDVDETFFGVLETTMK